MKEFNDFFKYLRFERNYSDHTILSYQNDLNQFSQFLITHLDIVKIVDVRHIHIRSWLVHLMREDYTAKSINRKLSSIKSYFKFLKKIGHVKINPASKINGPKIPKRLPAVLKASDISNSLDVSEEKDFSDIRNHLLINLLYQTGMRRAELINLSDGDIDIPNMQICVLGKGNKERNIPISEKLAAQMGAYQTVRDELFGDSADALLVTDKGRKMYPKFVYNIINSWISRISTVEKRSPHILRHSFATHLADNGAELNAIKELLGHSSLAATEIYMHNSVERIKGVYKKAHPRSVKKR